MNSTCLHAHTQVYPPVKWFYVLVAYLVTPLFALPNSYGCGLTDWDMSSMYAKLALFIFAAWAGTEVRGAHCVFVCGWGCVCVCVCWPLPLLDTCRCQAGGTHTHTPHTHAHTRTRNPQGNGVIVGLGICGVVLSATSSAATLMGDFRTGYICLAAPRARSNPRHRRPGKIP